MKTCWPCDVLLHGDGSKAWNAVRLSSFLGISGKPKEQSSLLPLEAATRAPLYKAEGFLQDGISCLKEGIQKIGKFSSKFFHLRRPREGVAAGPVNSLDLACWPSSGSSLVSCLSGFFLAFQNT